MDLRAQDLRGTLTEFSGNVAILDVLTLYIFRMISRICCLAWPGNRPGAALLVRDCPAIRPALRGHYLAEKFAQFIAWNIAVPLHFRHARPSSKFSLNEFGRDVKPLWGATAVQ